MAFATARRNGENGTRPFRVAFRELFADDDAVPFFPPLRCSRAIDFPFPFLPRRIAGIFGAALRRSLTRFNNVKSFPMLSTDVALHGSNNTCKQLHLTRFVEVERDLAEQESGPFRFRGRNILHFTFEDFICYSQASGDGVAFLSNIFQRGVFVQTRLEITGFTEVVC